MTWAIRLPRSAVFFGGCCLALSCVILVELSFSLPIVGLAPAPTARPAIEAGLPSFTLAPLADYAVVVRRPLFSSNRRAVASGDPDTAIASGDMALTGILISGGERIALIRYSQSPNKTARVRQGQNINGWIVGSITSDRVVLNKNGDSDILVLNKKSAITQQN